MKNLMIVFFSVLVFASCNGQTAGFKNLNPTQFDKGINQTNAQIVDVRTPEEYTSKHISAAKNININDANFEKQLLALDKEKPLYLYCLAGGRSKKAAEFAVNNGFKEVYNLEFGINSWISEDKHVVSGNGAPVQAGAIGMSFEDYLAHLKAAQKLVLVDFNAVWCGPCKQLKPIVKKVEKRNADKLEVFEIDVDKNSTVANTMNVRAIPLLILYKGGKEVWRNMGMTDESTIQDKVTEFSK
ncbi:MAG TPA: thioredoxin domain-containing protein [Chitinophagales bacterium]|nr:thioredoxin domain-containing protein [Chitinophagales bacterium]